MNSPGPAKRTTGRKHRGFGLLETFVVLAILVILAMLMLPSVRRARPAARQSQCKNNLKQIVLALHGYVDEYQTLPPAYTVDADGTRLHSWRTLILPWLDQEPLYNSIDLTKPWNDPVNAEAFERPMPAYHCPYMALVSPEACLHPLRGRSLSEILDGTENTLIVVEVSADQSRHWMEPEDTGLRFLLEFGAGPDAVHHGGIHGGLANGSVQYISGSIADAQRRALVTIAGSDNTSAHQQ